MRALSLIQPWAWLVIHGGKDVENRFWDTRFRGEFCVHASKGCRKLDYVYAVDWVACNISPDLAERIPKREDIEKGGIVGVATLADVLDPDHVPERRWHMEGQYGFVLTARRPVPFIACKGALGFWTVPSDVEARVNEALGRAS